MYYQKNAPFIIPETDPVVTELKNICEDGITWNPHTHNSVCLNYTVHDEQLNRDFRAYIFDITGQISIQKVSHLKVKYIPPLAPCKLELFINDVEQDLQQCFFLRGVFRRVEDDV